jgi:hypothetical protein
MTVGRPSLSLILVDFPSDHEVDENLSSECELIRSVIHNRGFSSAIKTVRISSVERFEKLKWQSYQKVGFVHLAGHGGKKGVDLIGGQISWETLANKLTIVAPRLASGQQRILNISTCYSAVGLRRLKPLLRGHFTGVYHFTDSKVKFSDAITAWAMFYNKKKLQRPHGTVIDVVNAYFDRKLLAFQSI